MVQSDMSKSPPSPAQEVQMELLDNPLPAAAAAQSYGKGARRKNRFKGSDGSTSSDTTSNSFVRQGASARSTHPYSALGRVMESALGDEAQGLMPDSLQESNISDFAEDNLSLRHKDELEAIPAEEIQGLKPEDLEESAPAEATQDTKPETEQAGL